MKPRERQKNPTGSEKVTIYDIAEAAGVSIATVSKVINNRGRVSEQTRERVLRIIRELNYAPNRITSALGGKSMYTLGLLIPDISNPFYSEIVRGAEDCGRKWGYNVLICNTDNDTRREMDYLLSLREKRVDGIILATASNTDTRREDLESLGIPVAFISREIPGFESIRVIVDNFRGGYLATRHLIDLGHRNIALFTEPLNIVTSSERLRGYAEALQEAGIPYRPEWVRPGGFGVESGYRLAEALLRDSHDPMPTAVFAANDQLAIGAIQAFKEAGHSIPEDISVVGFDNTILCTIVDPPLTTVAQPMYDMGVKVVNLLIEAIQNEGSGSERIVLEPKLVVRRSTAKPKSPLPR
ncbi:transcriptional regulator, LacI family [Planifilum fulgidum]|uniref:Transcriptional regulator, LacI family n=1 Tax=Planifilum fulgidum TaxID=201973 RepID=A0A1I2RFG8_9BACL|nr:LacI family DNA-binding transcriptional regulator [Planifilum fulgidum]SFG39222.1 transcriptional regulator, LacI family [Planifilum fulgidum]